MSDRLPRDEGTGTSAVAAHEPLPDWSRLRQDWQCADWPALSRWAATALERSADRARMALLVATAHLQLGDMVRAREFLLLAQDWGCDKRLLRQVLVAGLHDTLGRAAAISDDPARALAHFAAALATAAPANASHTAIQNRAREQLARLGVSAGSASVAALLDTSFASQIP